MIPASAVVFVKLGDESFRVFVPAAQDCAVPTVRQWEIFSKREIRALVVMMDYLRGIRVSLSVINLHPAWMIRAFTETSSSDLASLGAGAPPSVSVLSSQLYDRLSADNRVLLCRKLLGKFRFMCIRASWCTYWRQVAVLLQCRHHETNLWSVEEWGPFQCPGRLEARSWRRASQ